MSPGDWTSPLTVELVLPEAASKGGIVRFVIAAHEVEDVAVGIMLEQGGFEESEFFGEG